MVRCLVRAAKTTHLLACVLTFRCDVRAAIATIHYLVACADTSSNDTIFTSFTSLSSHYHKSILQVWVRLYPFLCCCYPAQQHYGLWQHHAVALQLAQHFAMHAVNFRAGTSFGAQYNEHTDKNSAWRLVLLTLSYF